MKPPKAISNLEYTEALRTGLELNLLSDGFYSIVIDRETKKIKHLSLGSNGFGSCADELWNYEEKFYHNCYDKRESNEDAYIIGLRKEHVLSQNFIEWINWERYRYEYMYNKTVCY